MYVHCVREHFTTSQFLSTEELGTSKSKTIYFKFEKKHFLAYLKKLMKVADFSVSTKPQNKL